MGEKGSEQYIGLPSEGTLDDMVSLEYHVKNFLKKGSVIPGEGKVVEGKFPEQINKTPEEPGVVEKFNNISKKIEDKVEKFLGFSMEEKYEVKKEPEKVREGNVIKVDFGNKKK